MVEKNQETWLICSRSCDTTDWAFAYTFSANTAIFFSDAFTLFFYDYLTASPQPPIFVIFHSPIVLNECNPCRGLGANLSIYQAFLAGVISFYLYLDLLTSSGMEYPTVQIPLLFLRSDFLENLLFYLYFGRILSLYLVWIVNSRDHF